MCDIKFFTQKNSDKISFITAQSDLFLPQVENEDLKLFPNAVRLINLP